MPPDQPAVARGASYRGVAERFNRAYTDPTWTPARVIYVSPSGTGDGGTAATPTSVASGLSSVQPGTQVRFLRGTYSGCFELSKDNGRSGTYDAPVVLAGEHNPDGTLGVHIDCCTTGRKTCFNLEAADHVAIDGFELVGGDYGVRSVGAGYAAADHQVGVAILRCDGHGQYKDPFFTGQSDWLVIEGVFGHEAGSGDGHGIYLSNGSDFNIVRHNELSSNASSDFQINADPASTCDGDGLAYTDPACDGDAKAKLGQGASDYMLVEGNFFHHGLGQGANFTSVRRSVVRNNIFALYAKHGVSFWQETANPKLGSAENLVAHNLFVTSQTDRQAVQFVAHSTRNRFENNVLLGVTLVGAVASANPSALLMEVDDTVTANVYRHNFYGSGQLSGRSPGTEETVRATFDAAWFTAFASHDSAGFAPSSGAPFLDLGDLLPEVARDHTGRARSTPTDLGPFERP